MVLWNGLCEKERQRHVESPRRAPVPRPHCAPHSVPVLVGPGFPEPVSPFQSTVRASSDEPSFASLTRTPGSAPQALPFPWSRHKRRSRPGGCGAVRKRDSRRTARIRGVVVIIASASARERRCPGGLKGRGAVAWAERALSERRRSEDIPLRARERAEGFQVVCVCDRSEKYEPTSRPVFHQWRLVHHLSNSRRRATRPATIRHPTTAPISPTGSSGFPPPQSASKTSP